MSSVPSLIIAAEDRARLLICTQGSSSEVAEQLEAELERALIVPLSQVPDDVVVMNSELEYELVSTGERRRLRLVYPGDVDASAARVSVLAPLGCALLGLSVGQTIDWQMPGGPRRLRVLSAVRAPASA